MKTPGWYAVRIELAFAISAIAAAVCLILTEPSFMGPGIRLADRPLTWLGIAVAVLGLVWMVRILRADPERGRSSWRATRER